MSAFKALKTLYMFILYVRKLGQGGLGKTFLLAKRLIRVIQLSLVKVDTWLLKHNFTQVSSKPC
jgi:hypothetical protein